VAAHGSVERPARSGADSRIRVEPLIEPVDRSGRNDPLSRADVPFRYRDNSSAAVLGDRYQQVGEAPRSEHPGSDIEHERRRRREDRWGREYRRVETLGSHLGADARLQTCSNGVIPDRDTGPADTFG
jgi:hypothetical protein